MLAPGPPSSTKRPPEMPQWEITGTGQPMRSSDRTTWAAGAALATRMMLSAPASLSRESCGTMSTSSVWNFSTPARASPCAAAALVSPSLLDSPHGLLISMRPGFLAPYVFAAYWMSPLSTITSTADTRNT